MEQDRMTIFEAVAGQKLDPAGRLMIPAYMRKALGVGPGEEVCMQLKDGRLTVWKPEDEPRQETLAERFKNSQDVNMRL